MGRHNSIFLIACLVICLAGCGYSQKKDNLPDKDEPLETDLDDKEGTPEPETDPNKEAAVKPLRCYQCSSNDTGCGEEFDAVKAQQFLKNCPAKDHEGVAREYKLCRKIYQSIRDELSIFRMCGYEKYHRDCYITLSEEYYIKTCQCFGDKCNGASTVTIFSMLFVVPFIIWLLH